MTTNVINSATTETSGAVVVKHDMELNPPDTAPKDGTPILGIFGFPWLQAAAWSEDEERWIVAALAAGENDGIRETWWENERVAHRELRGWLPMLSAACRNNDRA